MRNEVTEVESIINEKINSIWTDDLERDYYLKINALDLSDKRLWIVYCLLNHSIIKTAVHFRVDRGTVRNRINYIKNLLV